MTSFLPSILIILVCLSSNVFAQKKTEEIEIHEDWRLQKEKDDIQVFTRWVISDDNKARQMHAVMEVEADLQSVVRTLTDEKQVILWLNRATTYYHFDQEDESNWYAYTRFDIPWPMDDQDLVTRNSLSKDSITRQVHLDIEGIMNILPEEEKVTRIPHFEGSWDFTPMENGKIKVDYFLYVKSKPELPRWLIDPFVEYGMWRTFDSLREVALENTKSIIPQPAGIN